MLDSLSKKFKTIFERLGSKDHLKQRTDEKSGKDSQKEIAQRMLDGTFTLTDFVSQIEMMNESGSFRKAKKHFGGEPDLTLKKLEEEIFLFKSIFSLMTPKERNFPHILDDLRKHRIARGAGTSIVVVNQLLERFEQTKQCVTMIEKTGKLKYFFQSRHEK